MHEPKRHSYPSERQDQYIVRFPDGMRDKIKEIAKYNQRSMNSEIVFALQERMRMTAGAKASETNPAVIGKTDALQGVNPITQDERTV